MVEIVSYSFRRHEMGRCTFSDISQVDSGYRQFWIQNQVMNEQVLSLKYTYLNQSSTGLVFVHVFNPPRFVAIDLNLNSISKHFLSFDCNSNLIPFRGRKGFLRKFRV